MKAYLAGGCFWGVEDLFRKLPGVTKTSVGYTGGQSSNPTYNDVKTGSTGHAEAIEIEFDPSIISFESLLEFFFKIHDPTTINRQGNDVGSQYRSAIFYIDAVQKQKAETMLLFIEKSGRWKKPIITRLEPFKAYYKAEEYHQDYLEKNPNGYTCHYIRE